MTTRVQQFWYNLIGAPQVEAPASPSPPQEPSTIGQALALKIPPNDPIVPYFQSVQGVVEVDKINLNSTVLESLKDAGVRLTIPLVSQGELIGLLNLGPRLSEQEYSADDRRLLSNLAIQAAPALRVAQLVRLQQAEARQLERFEQELRVARIIQQTLLPQELPKISGWRVTALYQPAREVGGDFYDFLELPDGRMGFFIGDVTDKGVPAALVMASTRSTLRTSAERLISPGAVLERANDLLCEDIPPNMFATCLYAILEPESGRLRFANAGHNPPYLQSEGQVKELRATGMPLGLMPGMTYDEVETIIGWGEKVLLSSDGLVEAHNPQNEMFGFPRIASLLSTYPSGTELIDYMVEKWVEFTGPGHEQEDDITLVCLGRLLTSEVDLGQSAQTEHLSGEPNWETIAEFSLPSQPGNERQAIELISEAIQTINLPHTQVERLKTAVGEATMNAMEHGNKYQADLPVNIRVCSSESALAIRITDHGGGGSIPQPEEPDLEAKLAGEQTPRGWGLFLIKNMVDEMKITRTDTTHTVELLLYRKGGEDAPV